MFNVFFTTTIVLFFVIVGYFLLNKYLKNSFWREIVIPVFIAMVTKWGFGEISKVPTGSMEGTIMPGDFTFVSKLHYGPRTPKTLLQVPLTHQTTRFLEIPSYLSWIKMPMLNLPGFTKIKRGDVVVFNTPSERGVNTDMKTFYVKRCMGLPSEEISVKNNDIFINGVNVDTYENRLLYYILESNIILTTYWFKHNNILKYNYLGERKYVISTTPQNAQKIREKEEVVSFETYHNKHEDIFINNAPSYESDCNWGSIKIPYKGMKIELNPQTLKLYGYAIELDSCGKIKFDCIEIKHNAIRIKEDKIESDLKKIKTYTFTQDHYFMIGDNRCDSVDSRLWGFVPQDHIYARTVCILFSKNPNSWISGLNFKHSCTSV